MRYNGWKVFKRLRKHRKHRKLKWGKKIHQEKLMRSWCRAAFLPGEIDSIDIGVKAQATDGDGDVSTDGDGEGGLEEAKDWPRLRKLLDVDEKSRLFLDMPLGWQDFNCLLQWLCLIFRILESVFFTCMISRLIFAVLLETHVKRTRKSWGANQLLTLSTPRFEAAYSFLDATQSAVFQCFWFFDGFLVLPLFDFMLICCDLTIWFSFCSFDWTWHTFGKGVRQCSDALLNVQDFLGRFLVKEFDHEAGCENSLTKWLLKKELAKKTTVTCTSHKSLAVLVLRHDFWFAWPLYIAQGISENPGWGLIFWSW